MRHIKSFLVAFIAAASLCLASCSTDEILGRLDKLEQQLSELSTSKIASVESQISSIRESISLLEKVNNSLEAKDEAIERKIEELKAYAERLKKETTDWASATFCTIEQYNSLCDEVAALKVSVANMDFELRRLISELETSMKGWVNEQLAGYMSIADAQAQLDALAAMYTENKEEIASMRDDLASAKEDLLSAYQQALEDIVDSYNGVIESRIAASLAAVNQKIDDEIAALSARIDAIEKRLSDLEGKVYDLIKDNQKVIIRYTSADGKVLYPSSESWLNAVIESNTYEDGVGCMVLSHAIDELTSNAFKGNRRLTSIELDGMTSIAAEAFSGCSALTSVKISNSITSIGDRAFQDCASLTSDVIPNTVTSIGECEFYRCSALVSVTIPDSVTSIGSCAFMYCGALNSITIPDSVTSIGHGAFSCCGSLPAEGGLRYADTYLAGVADYSLGSYSIKEGTKWIGDILFDFDITSLSIPSSVTSIGDIAFFNLGTVILDSPVIAERTLRDIFGDQVRNYIIGDSISSIGDNTFHGCHDLTSVKIGKSVASISENAFQDCRSLRTVTLDCPAIVEKNYSRFNGIGNIFGKQVHSYIIGSSVTSIGAYVFDDSCQELSTVTLDCPAIVEKDYVWNERPMFQAFGCCENLKTFIIGESVTSIGECAFCYPDGDYFTAPASVIIGNSVTSISFGAFANCINLTSVTIPDSVTSIGNNAFASCLSLSSVTIGKAVGSLGDYVFLNCPNLTSVYCKPMTPPTLGVYAYLSSTSNLKIYVPAASVNAYKTATNWEEYVHLIESYDF